VWCEKTVHGKVVEGKKQIVQQTKLDELVLYDSDSSTKIIIVARSLALLLTSYD
jgi:hypothetical protein